MPGKPDAPVAFRKFAAVVLNGQPGLQKKMNNLFLVARAPRHLRRRIRKMLDILSSTPERLPGKSIPVRLKDAESEVVGRILAFHSFDPAFNKLGTKKSLAHDSMANLIRRVRSLLKEAFAVWPNASPTKPAKALELVNKYDSTMVDTQWVSHLLFYTGTPDVTPEYDLESDNSSSTSSEEEAATAASPKSVKLDLVSPSASRTPVDESGVPPYPVGFVARHSSADGNQYVANVPVDSRQSTVHGAQGIHTSTKKKSKKSSWMPTLPLSRRPS